MDRMWGIWGSHFNLPKAIFYLLKRDYRCFNAISIFRVDNFLGDHLSKAAAEALSPRP